MSVLTCKMCGGTLEIDNNSTVAICEYCGTKQTLPKLNDERKANLYDRANHFRRNNEFDKAMGIYEQILNEDNTDAEVYWSLVLCRYGIEYVEEAFSHKRIPTVNRAQFTSIFDDDNYRLALQYADEHQRSVYEEEAKLINEIQKGILEISQKEEPFDVFICYKETDNLGKRTPDSVLANDLYHQLTQEGFKVFFSRITLEDKLGSAYEPYIFAALNSAKVMVVLGTKPEYFNAVWVKNEWSRYLALIKNGAKKMLIPAYKDMDPYDLPEEFSHLQAQDMSKLGFVQDLIRGIKKIVDPTEPKIHTNETAVIGGNVNVDSLLKRAYMFLEDADWSSADEYCEKVLDIAPESVEAYLGKLMVEYKIRRPEEFRDCKEPFDSSNHYRKVLRFADEKLVEKLKADILYINERNENERLQKIYTSALEIMEQANTQEQYLEAMQLFESIEEYNDAEMYARMCSEKAEECYKKMEDWKNYKIYRVAKIEMENARYRSALKKFQTISGWRDVDDQIAVCQQRIDRRRKNTKRYIKKGLIVVGILCVLMLLLILVKEFVIPEWKYNHAVTLMKQEKYDEAEEVLNEVYYDYYYYKCYYDIPGNNDKVRELRDELLDAIHYERALEAIEKEDYVEAYEYLTYVEEGKVGLNIEEIRTKAYQQEFDNMQVGDIVEFNYDEWIVLAIEGEKVLLFYWDVAEEMTYSEAVKELNSYEIIEEDLARVVETEIEGKYCDVFLLDFEEATKYYNSFREETSSSGRAGYDYLLFGDALSGRWLRGGNYISENTRRGYSEECYPVNEREEYVCRPVIWVDWVNSDAN